MKRSSASTSVRRLSSAFCSSLLERLAEDAGLDRLAQPQPLAVRGDVLDLVRDRAAIGLAQVRERIGKRRARDRTCAGSARESAPSAPASEPSGPGSSAGSPSGSRPSGSSRAARWPCVRWAFSSEIAACTACSSSSLGLRHSPAARLGAGAVPAAAAAAAARGGRRGHRRQLQPEVAEDARRRSRPHPGEGLDPLQEAAGLGPLDDPVIVGRGHRHDLVGADHRADAGEPDRVRDRAGRDDRALTDHQPRHRGERPEAARIGQGQVGPGQIVGASACSCAPSRRARRRRRGTPRSSSRPASRITGTISVRLPSFFSTSTARPRLTAPSSTRWGLPSRSRKWWAITGISLGCDARDRVRDQVREGDALAGLLELLGGARRGRSPGSCGTRSRSGSDGSRPCSGPARRLRP